MNMTNRTRRRYRIWRDGYGGWEHYPYGNSPPAWWVVRPDLKEEKRNLEEYIRTLKDELNIAIADIKKLEKMN